MTSYRIPRALAALAALGAFGCDGGQTRAPETGPYDYVASHPIIGATGDSERHEGRLILEEASRDEITGHWEVARYADALERGSWVGGAYEIYAYPTYGGTIVHRLSPTGIPGELACEGHYSIVLEEVGESQVPVTCSVEASP